jgi:hypothetical protein
VVATDPRSLKGNNLGLFFCWAVSDGLAESCTLSENRQYGVSIGHRDTDSVIKNCVIERNGEVGILFRDEGGEFRAGHRNCIENCTVRDTGEGKPGIGVDIRGKTQDIVVSNTKLENTASGKQQTGIHLTRRQTRSPMRHMRFCYTWPLPWQRSTPSPRP